LSEDVGAAHDFSDVEHTIELLGTCAECRARQAAEAAATR
jgi:Fur family ferric uptake transcriptional regulator